MAFLSKSIADEIRSSFPGPSNEGLRLEIRRYIREDLDQDAFFHKFALQPWSVTAVKYIFSMVRT